MFDVPHVIALYEARGYTRADQAPEPDVTPLDQMTVAELREIADAAGVDHTSLTKKADLITSIEGASTDG